MKQVLYVEDSATAHLLMKKYIQGLCEITITPTLNTAIGLLKEKPFDLMITDFLFPEGDSMGLIQSVRADPAFDNLPIIVVSSSLDELLLGRVLQAGANDAVSKPIYAVEFRKLVEKMMATPYKRTIDQNVWGVSCFQWISKGVYHQYCAELGETVTGATREEASKKMLGILQAKIESGLQLGSTSNETVVTHIVHTAPRVK